MALSKQWERIWLVGIIATCIAVSNCQTNRGQIKKSQFCAKYNCWCPNPVEEIKCKLNSTTNEVDFIERDVQRLDLSDNSLQMIVWGDSVLNLHELILRNNNISVIHEKMFNKVPHLHFLDLSMNRISELKEQYFTDLNVLEKLNLSRAFVPDYKINRELCELVGLKVLDLSYTDLDEFTLECWRTSPHLVEIHLRYARNVEASSINWLPVIGNQSLRLIDLTGSDIKKIEINQWLNMNNLASLSLSHNPKIDKNSVYALLKTNTFFKQLRYLHLANISADSKSLPIGQIIADQKSPLGLEFIDISDNNYNDDLNKLLFNQANLINLTSFIARNNRLYQCAQRLTKGERETFLSKLELLDLSYNLINDSSCFYAIRPITTLECLDLNHNRLSIISSDIKSKDFASIYSEMINLTYVDLSYNLFTSLVFYFNVNHTRIQNFDVSHNKLKEFRILSLTVVSSAKYPFNLDQDTTVDNKVDEEDDAALNMHYIDDTEDDYDETIVDSNNRKEKGKDGVDDEEDDDQRFIVIDRLDLSNNKFSSLNLQHMLQSIKNVVYLNLSSNPIEQVIGMSESPSFLTNSTSIKPTTASQGMVDDEIMCIDRLDLKNCKIHAVPHLIHVCINSIDLQSNLISGRAHIIFSNYSLYFLDYINLQSNNITYIHFIRTDFKYKQDLYAIQNSPIHYFYGETNSTALNHTFVDARKNEFYRCDCNQIRTADQFGKVKLLSNCYDDDFYYQCRKLNSDKSSSVKYLNKKLRALFIITCLILIVLSMSIIYYMCSDFLRNVKPYERLRMNITRLLVSLHLVSKYDPSVGVGADKNIGVQYKKLVNDGSLVSQIEINNP